MGNWLNCYEEQHSLLPKWSMTLLKCISKIRGASKSIYKPYIIHTMLSLLRLTLKLHTKYQILGTLSDWEMRCCSIMRDAHCCWSISWPSSHVLVRWEELLKACTSLLLVTWCHFYWGRLSNRTQITRFTRVASQCRKGDDIILGYVSIVNKVIKHLSYMHKIDRRSC